MTMFPNLMHLDINGKCKSHLPFKPPFQMPITAKNCDKDEEHKKITSETMMA